MNIASRSESEWAFKIFQCTRAIFTFGTPHYGSPFASLAISLARFLRLFHYFNIKLLKAVRTVQKKPKRPGSESEGTWQWQDDFLDLLRRRKDDNRAIYFFCGVEQIGASGIPLLNGVNLGFYLRCVH